MEELAYAKVNLCLYVGPVRASDGRHELVSVMQSVSLADRLVLRDGPADQVVCPGVDGPNLALRAIEAFRAATGWDGPGQVLEIDKRIPVAAGLGGGSADAAAALRLMRRRAGVGDEALLLELAVGLGADVPGQVRPGRVLARGAGERLTRLDRVAAAAGAFLIVPAQVGLGTADVYAKFDRLGPGRSMAELERLAGELARGGPVEPLNDLQAAAVELAPAIERTLDEVAEAGARPAMVCGSGPTVLGLFESVAAANRAAERLGGREPEPVVAVPTGGMPVGGVRHNGVGG